MPSLSEFETKRRIKSFEQGGMLKEMAARVGISKATMGCWLSYHKLYKHKTEPTTYLKEGQVIIRKTGDPYCEDRPQWERDRIRHFGSMLIRTSDMTDQKIDLFKFMDIYREQYGTMEGGDVANG
jgi:hypothetical protein